MQQLMSNDHGTYDGEAKSKSTEWNGSKRPTTTPEMIDNDPNQFRHVNVSETDYSVWHDTVRRELAKQQPTFSVVLPADMGELQAAFVRKRQPNTPDPESSYEGQHNYYDDILMNLPTRPQKQDGRYRNEQRDDDWNIRTRGENREKFQRPCELDWNRMVQEKDDEYAWLEDGWNVQTLQQERLNRRRKISVLANFDPAEDDGTSRGVTPFANKRVSPKLQELIQKANWH